ncbi:hypothetical protein D5F01_LYC01003 [Larimichthys crocea]|uniref:Uncharacterized protein n=1 Tax=Larimichthys crocea TaxID=215358 RepID=A0A6G0JAQ7_LARCR|nr:hypothetical protein D5F01_LYC01003 [Larimichthys crocea]
MGASSAKATTPVEIVEKNNPLVKGIGEISKKFNRRWPEIDQVWPAEGTFDPEVIRTLQVLVNTYKAEQKKGRKGQIRKEKREIELARLDKNIERSLETAKLAEKHNAPFSHISPLMTPPPYETKSESTSLYPQLPLLTTEGRYSLENDDHQILETGRATTTIVMTPETKSKQRPTSSASGGPCTLKTQLKDKDADGKKKTLKSIREDSNDDIFIGGYAPSIKKLLARAERRGKKTSNARKTPDPSDSDDDSNTSISSVDSDSSQKWEEVLEEEFCRLEQADEKIRSMKKN